jgi:hypothetical protein
VWPIVTGGRLTTVAISKFFTVSNSVLLTFLLTPWCRALLEKQTGSQLVENFPAFYGARRFITAFTTAKPPAPVLRQINSVAAPSYFMKIYFNIIWVFQVVCYSQVTPPKTYIHLSSPPYVLHAPPISFFSILSPEYPYLRILSHGVSESFLCLCWTYDAGGASGSHSECTVFTVTPSTGSDFH